MLDPNLNDRTVAAIVSDLRRDDPQLGRNADFVWSELTAGEGPGMVSQAALQNWLWWLLPKRLAQLGELEGIAEAASVLFDRIGAVRYAEICQSDTTDEVFAAWRRSPKAGVKACQRALAASGVEPEDLDDFAWGQVFGIWESHARDAVERALEAAIDEGRLDRSARGWRAVARQITAETLDAEHPDGVGQSWRSLVASERADAWATNPWVPAAQRPQLAAIAEQFVARPADPDPDQALSSLQPLTWLLDTCRDGVTLTASFYLSPTAVREAVERFGWWDWDKPPRSEADVPQLDVIRETARRLKLVQRRGRTLKTTTAGRSFLDDPLSFWDRFVASLGGTTDYDQAVADVLALALIDAKPSYFLDVHSNVTSTLATQGWRRGDEPVDTRGHSWPVSHIMYAWRTWGLTAYEEDTPSETDPENRHWGRSMLALTPAGHHAVSLWLHQRITGPRSHA